MSHYFGTDGIRGNADHSPLLQQPFLHKLGAALTQLFHTQATSPHIVISHDGRHSASRIIQDLAQGIEQSGGTVLLADMLPTPALEHIVRQHANHYVCGIMVSASHNAACDNGLKIVTPHGKLSDVAQETLRTYIANSTAHIDSTLSPQLVPLPIHHQNSYAAYIMQLFPQNFLRKKNIVLDTAHGATSHLATELFTHYGAKVRTLANHPSGFNINEGCGSTHPHYLQHHIKRNDAIGFAFDGDGDRVITVTKEKVIKNGDDTLCFLFRNPDFIHTPTIVSTLMCNSGFEALLPSYRKTLLRTPVGDKHIIRALKKHRLILGGEPSGHTIILPYAPYADGIITALAIAYTASSLDEWSMPTFSHFPSAQRTIPIITKEDLTSPKYQRMIQSLTPKKSDGRIVIRYSGTEPILRIMVEHRLQSEADVIADQLVTQLNPALTKDANVFSLNTLS